MRSSRSPRELVEPSESPAVGTFFKSGSPAVAEVLGRTELDFLLIDRQHASPDLETIESLVRAADLTDLPVFVRLPDGNLDLVTNLLDAGVTGIVVPQVESAAGIRAVVEATRFSGTRSYAGSTRAGGFGSREYGEYVEWVENELVVVAMIETEPGLAAASEIAAEDGVSALMAGPADLALSLDVERGAPEHRDAIQQVRTTAADAGIGFGQYVGSASDLDEAGEESSFLLYSSDTGMLATHLGETL